MSSVKNETSEKAEIKKMAAKKVTDNKEKESETKNKQLPLKLFKPNIKIPPGIPLTVNRHSIDFPSVCGRFGWEEINNALIPYIFRGKEKYCPARIASIKLLNNLLCNLDPEIYNEVRLPAYKMTPAERSLLDDINFKHSDKQFGNGVFTLTDTIIHVEELKSFYHFLNICYYKLKTRSCNITDQCGYVLINNKSVIPYTRKNSMIYVPTFYFEGEINFTTGILIMKGWELHFLKFLMTIQGIRKQLYTEYSGLKVINIECLREYLSIKTPIEPYWPNNILDQYGNKNFPQGYLTNVHKNWTKLVELPSAIDLSQTEPPLFVKLHKSTKICNSSLPFPPVLLQKKCRNTPTTFNSNDVPAEQQSLTQQFEIETHSKLPCDWKKNDLVQPPYIMQLTIIDNKYTWCINKDPHNFKEFLVSLPDICFSYFQKLSLNQCKDICNRLHIKLYNGNVHQMQLFLDSRKFNNCNDCLPLVLLSDIEKFFPQLKYISNSSNVLRMDNDCSPSKIQKMS